jgi:hypothetical protein
MIVIIIVLVLLLVTCTFIVVKYWLQLFHTSYKDCISLIGTLQVLMTDYLLCRSQWPRGLRRWLCIRCLPGIVGSNSAGAWMSVFYECWVLSSRGLFVGLITRPEESYRVWCVCLNVIVTPRQRGCPGSLGAVAPRRKEKNCKYYRGIRSEGLRETTQISAGIAGLLNETSTQNLPNSKQQREPCDNTQKFDTLNIIQQCLSHVLKVKRHISFANLVLEAFLYLRRISSSTRCFWRAEQQENQVNKHPAPAPRHRDRGRCSQIGHLQYRGYVSSNMHDHGTTEAQFGVIV